MTKLVLLDTDQQLAQELESACGSAGIEIQTTAMRHGSESLPTGEAPDAIVLDVTAGHTGDDNLVATLRAQHPEVPVVLVFDSEMKHLGRFKSLLASQWVDFVLAPVVPVELCERLGRLLARERTTSGTRRASSRNTGTGPGTATKPATAMPLFGHLVPELHNPDSGRIDAVRVSALFAVPLAAIARALGKEPSAVHKTPDAPSLQPGLAVFERIAAALLHMTRSPETLRIWLNTPNPDLEGQPPLTEILAGGGDVVADLLEDALLGQPG